MKLDRLSDYAFKLALQETEKGLNKSLNQFDEVLICLDLSDPESLAFAQTLLSAKSTIASIRNAIHDVGEKHGNTAS